MTRNSKAAEMTPALASIFGVLDTFKCQPNQDIRLGSFNHLFLVHGASQSGIDRAIQYMIEEGWLIANSAPGVRPGGHCLTEAGSLAMRKLDLSSYGQE